MSGLPPGNYAVEPVLPDLASRITALAEAYKTRKLSPVEVTKAMLDRIEAGRQLVPRGLVGLFPAASVGDDIQVYADESRTGVRAVIHGLRQQFAALFATEDRSIVLDEVTHAVPLAKALVAGGVRVLEITLRTPAAMDSMRAIKAALDPLGIMNPGAVLRASEPPHAPPSLGSARADGWPEAGDAGSSLGRRGSAGAVPVRRR